MDVEILVCKDENTYRIRETVPKITVTELIVNFTNAFVRELTRVDRNAYVRFLNRKTKFLAFDDNRKVMVSS